jgi:hypothetical protein
MRATAMNKESRAQNKKGKPGWKLERLLPRGGAMKDPTCEKVKINPKVIPGYVSPAPFVSWASVMITDINASMNKPNASTRAHTARPSANGIRPMPSIPVVDARNSMVFLARTLSDR